MTLCRGEIWLTNFNPTKKNNEVGKIRPSLILQNDELNFGEYPTTIVMPLSTSLIEDAEPLRYRIKAQKDLEKDSDLLIAQIRSIDNSRFIKKLTILSKKEVDYIQSLLNEVLN